MCPFSSTNPAFFISSPLPNKIFVPFKLTLLMYEGNVIFNVGSLNKPLYILEVSSTALISTFSFVKTVVKLGLLICNSTFVSGSFNSMSTVFAVLSIFVFPSNSVLTLLQYLFSTFTSLLGIFIDLGYRHRLVLFCLYQLTMSVLASILPSLCSRYYNNKLRIERLKLRLSSVVWYSK